jgi:cell division protein FtsL
MTLMDALILLGLILIIFGCIFFILAIIMERHYDRKLWELDNKLKQDEKWRKEYRR